MSHPAIGDHAAGPPRVWGLASAEETAAPDDEREAVSGFVGVMVALMLSIPLWALIAALLHR